MVKEITFLSDKLYEPILMTGSKPSLEPRQVDERKLEKVCLEFEAIFINQMLKAMRKTIPKTNFFKKESGRELFESLFDSEISKIVSQKGGFGLGKILYKKMIEQIDYRNAFTIQRQGFSKR